MSAPLVALLSVEAIVFVAFIILAFRWLFAVRRDAVVRSGKTLPDLGATLAAFREGLSDPRYAKLRWGIAGCIVILLASAPVVPSLMRP